MRDSVLHQLFIAQVEDEVDVPAARPSTSRAIFLIGHQCAGGIGRPVDDDAMRVVGRHGGQNAVGRDLGKPSSGVRLDNHGRGVGQLDLSSKVGQHGVGGIDFVARRRTEQQSDVVQSLFAAAVTMDLGGEEV